MKGLGYCPICLKHCRDPKGQSQGFPFNVWSSQSNQFDLKADILASTKIDYTNPISCIQHGTVEPGNSNSLNSGKTYNSGQLICTFNE